ncbi:MAG: hypothetical protein ABII64_00535 [Elusimicrobiota bacterium]
MSKKLKYAIISLRISTIIYILIGLAFTIFLIAGDKETVNAKWFVIATIILGIVLVVFVEIVIKYIKKRRFWAWVAGLCIGGIYLPSLFLPLGIFILLGLLDVNTRREFGIGVSKDNVN